MESHKNNNTHNATPHTQHTLLLGLKKIEANKKMDSLLWTLDTSKRTKKFQNETVFWFLACISYQRLKFNGKHFFEKTGFHDQEGNQNIKSSPPCSKHYIKKFNYLTPLALPLHFKGIMSS